MDDLIHALDKSIEKYRSMQERHIKAFETELMPDLELQNFEREHAFAEMKNRFDGFLGKIQNNDDYVKTGTDYVDTALLYTTQIKTILQCDAELKEKIIVYREQLKRHMNETGKFKTALNGYAGSAGTDKYSGFSLKS